MGCCPDVIEISFERFVGLGIYWDKDKTYTIKPEGKGVLILGIFLPFSSIHIYCDKSPDNHWLSFVRNIRVMI
jgi:hypothetical protein